MSTTPDKDGSFLNLYTGSDYASAHPDWHLKDAPGKAEDLLPGILTAVDKIGGPTVRIADIGGGVGGVLHETLTRLEKLRPQVAFRGTLIEVSPPCCGKARELYPHLDVRQKLLADGDGPFDIAIFADVLEHVENPYELLRQARREARFIAVRQPLLESYGAFRHNSYRNEREHWGHISYFNYRSFLAIAEACGWSPLSIALQAPWELSGAGGTSFFKRLIVRMNRLQASYFMTGFYLNGTFARMDGA